jgi:site-specific recombinase XerD
MIWQGLGTTELSNLQVKDVKLREGKIYIAGSRRSNEREMKLEATQILDLMEYTLQTRNELLQLTKKESEQLILSTGKGQNTHNLLTSLMKKLKALNSSVNSIKQIRTSVITHWLKNHNLREVQFMVGHRYVSSTEAYLINDLDDLQEDVSKYHPF